MKVEQLLGARPPNYLGPLPRPTCNCKGTGCWGCMDVFIPNIKARWMYVHSNPCAEIKLPVYDTKAVLQNIFGGEVGIIDRFKIITSK
jgi:hypothetical protein